MTKSTLSAIALCWALALPAHAGVWQIDIDTTPLAGTAGYLDLQLNPGAADALPLQARISDFSTDAWLGGVLTDGAASGSLAGTLVLDNVSALNAWLQELIFGNRLAFRLAIDDAPDSGSGTRFATLLWDADFNALLAAAGDYSALRIDVAPDTGSTIGASPYVSVNAVPEPGVMASLLAGLAMMAWVVGRRRLA